MKAELIEDFVKQRGTSKIAANLLGYSERTIRDFILLTKYMKRYPKLRLIKMKHTALMLIKEFKIAPDKLQEKILEILSNQEENGKRSYQENQPITKNPCRS